MIITNRSNGRRPNLFHFRALQFTHFRTPFVALTASLLLFAGACSSDDSSEESTNEERPAQTTTTIPELSEDATYSICEDARGDATENQGVAGTPLAGGDIVSTFVAADEENIQFGWESVAEPVAAANVTRQMTLESSERYNVTVESVGDGGKVTVANISKQQAFLLDNVVSLNDNSVIVTIPREYLAIENEFQWQTTVVSEAPGFEWTDACPDGTDGRVAHPNADDLSSGPRED